MSELDHNTGDDGGELKHDTTSNGACLEVSDNVSSGIQCAKPNDDVQMMRCDVENMGENNASQDSIFLNQSDCIQYEGKDVTAEKKSPSLLENAQKPQDDSQPSGDASSEKQDDVSSSDHEKEKRRKTEEKAGASTRRRKERKQDNMEKTTESFVKSSNLEGNGEGRAEEDEQLIVESEQKVSREGKSSKTLEEKDTLSPSPTKDLEVSQHHTGKPDGKQVSSEVGLWYKKKGDDEEKNSRRKRKNGKRTKNQNLKSSSFNGKTSDTFLQKEKKENSVTEGHSIDSKKNSQFGTKNAAENVIDTQEGDENVSHVDKEDEIENTNQDNNVVPKANDKRHMAPNQIKANDNVKTQNAQNRKSQHSNERSYNRLETPNMLPAGNNSDDRRTDREHPSSKHSNQKTSDGEYSGRNRVKSQGASNHEKIKEFNPRNSQEDLINEHLPKSPNTDGRDEGLPIEKQGKRSRYNQARTDDKNEKKRNRRDPDEYYCHQQQGRDDHRDHPEDSTNEHGQEGPRGDNRNTGRPTDKRGEHSRNNQAHIDENRKEKHNERNGHRSNVEGFDDNPRQTDSQAADRNVHPHRDRQGKPPRNNENAGDTRHRRNQNWEDSDRGSRPTGGRPWARDGHTQFTYRSDAAHAREAKSKPEDSQELSRWTPKGYFDERGIMELFFRRESPFSQHHPCHFTLNDIKFNCTEQHMMYMKAVFAGDKDMEHKIRHADNPALQKTLGREVQGLDLLHWGEWCEFVVYNANLAKFSQNQDLREILMATKNKILVEANPTDSQWGIGLTKDDPRAWCRKTWRGANRLGYILMDVRRYLSSASIYQHCYVDYPVYSYQQSSGEQPAGEAGEGRRGDHPVYSYQQSSGEQPAGEAGEGRRVDHPVYSNQC